MTPLDAPNAADSKVIPLSKAWETAEPTRKPAVPDEEAMENIRLSVNQDYPILVPQPTRKGSCIFVAGGPTLRKFLPEIKRRADAGEYIITSNNTHDYLVDNGIKITTCVLLDPKEVVKDYVKKVQPDTCYMISTCANQKVWEAMKERGAKLMKVMVAYGINGDADMKLMNQIYAGVNANCYLAGGTMTALRAWPLAGMLGFNKIEMYGFDSCFDESGFKQVYEGTDAFRLQKERMTVYEDDNGKHVIDEPEDGGFFYAYKKARRETVQEVEFKGRIFLSSRVLVHQAMQIEKWYDRLESQIDIEIHGDSLSSWVLECHKKELADARAAVGDKRWTDSYGAMMREMHEKGNFGIHGYTDIEWSARCIISMLCTLQRPITVMDYGSGSGTYAEAVHKVFKMVNVTCYDPFHPKFRDNPEPGIHDVVNCTDVMEHVELECVDNTLKYIADHAKFAACFSIGVEDAIKLLPDGRNAHVTQKSPKWWANKLREHFTLVEAIASEGMVLFVCQHIDMADRVEKDGGYERTELGGRLRFASKVGGV